MVAILVRYLLIWLCSCFLEAVIVVDRGIDGHDVFTRNASVPCRILKAHHQSDTTCRCDFSSRTFGGNDPPCSAFPLCTVLSGTRPPYQKGVVLIRQNVTSLPLRRHYCDVVGVELWNVPSYVNEIGKWVDVSDFGLRYFDVTSDGQKGRDESLNVNIPFETWQGQLIRLLFDCGQKRQQKQDCAVLKVRGRVIYPFYTSKLNPSPTKPNPTCLDDFCTDNDDVISDDGGSGGIIAGIVAGVIVLTIGIVLIRVCRHKLPCWDLPSPTSDNDTDTTEPTRSKSTTPEYEELLMASQTNGVIEPDVTQYENDNARNGGNFNGGAPTQGHDGEEIGVYYSTIDTLPHQYEPPQSDGADSSDKTGPNDYEQLQPVAGRPVYLNCGADAGSTLGEEDTRGSVSSPVYHEVDDDDA